MSVQISLEANYLSTYQVCQLLTITIYSFYSTKQYISIMLKRCQFKSNWKLIYGSYFDICLTMSTASINLGTSPQLNESFEELLLFQCDFHTTAKMLPWYTYGSVDKVISDLISGVMVRMLALNVVDPWVLACLDKPKTIKLVSMQH